MTTDFTYGKKQIVSGGPFKPSGKDMPSDARTRVECYADIASIPNPHVGLKITVKVDETNNNKMTDYIVKSLKANSMGVADSAINEVVRYVDYLGASSGGGVSQEDINTAVNNYLTEHPVSSGATEAQAAQIEANKTAIGDENSGLVKEINNIKNTELQNLNTSIQTLETLVGVDETGLPSGDANIIASINRIDSKTLSESTNIFKNKIANFLGDSQTEVNSHKTKIYHDWVKEILGLSKANNYGVSGTTIAKKNTSDNTAMCIRYANMDNNADLICVMGGVNDRWFNNQLGKFGDTDPITFYGAMETLCDGLLTKYPGKTIIFITPTEQNNNSCNSANRTGYTPTDFANAMKRVCAKYSIPVFDANTCSGIYPLNEANASLYTTDKLHLNNKGHEVLGNKLSKFILNGANVVVIKNDDGGESGGGSTGDTYGNIVISKSTTIISEGGRDTFTVALDKAPTNSQIVNISSNNSDVTLSTNTLTFDSSNYSKPQTVTINVAEDSDTINDNCTLTLSSTNVSSKTIAITITDNDSAGETPIENQFIGKTVSVTKNCDNKSFAHLTALLNVDDDMKSNSTYNIVLNGSNAINMSDASNTGGSLFSDNSGEVSNGSFVAEVSNSSTFTQTVSNGNLTITATPRNGAISTNYVKVPIMISGSTPYSFQIDEIKVIVNDVERNILKLGSFFASDKEALTIE